MSFDPGWSIYHKYLVFQGEITKKNKEIMSFTAKIQKFFAKLTACYRELMPDVYEHTEEYKKTGVMANDGNFREYRIPGNIVGGQYGG